MKVYTKGGDSGTTSLIGGQRVAKDDIRVEAYGTVDELTAFVALLCDKISMDEGCAEYVEDLVKINSTLMSIEAHLACGEESLKSIPPIADDTVTYLEKRIDTLQESLPAITKFTIPGGDMRVSMSHICRTICRRAERQVVGVARKYSLEENVEIYLNRLSDYFYTLGRTLTQKFNALERVWNP